MEQILLNNRYRLEKRIGIGGMAYVYEAEDLLLKRKVAIKILKQQYVEDDEFLRKFDNEAQSAASLSHPNIVNVYDVGNETVDGKSLHYIVMELVEGTTLKEAIAVQGKMSNAAIQRISKQIARALETAHEHHIIHRDIKPANILIMKSGDVKVADFGIARISSAATLTYTNSILGTVHYISPEQAKGKFIDEKSDLYSLGVLMYEMATGRVPFDAENSVGIAIKHIQEEPVPPVEWNPALDEGLNKIILKCLEKEPGDRYYDAETLIHDLDHYKDLDDTVLIAAQSDDETAKMTRPKFPLREAVYHSKPNEEKEEEETKKGNRRWGIFLVLLGLVTALGIILFFNLANQRRLDQNSTKVPSVINLEEKEALKMLEKNSLKGRVVSRTSSDKISAGLVIEQNIVEGTRVDKGTNVDLVISTGKGKIPVPDVRNLTVEQATIALENAGLRIGQSNYIYDDAVQSGNVVGTDPEKGESVEADSRINLKISRGKRETTSVVPVLTGMNQTEAMTAINSANLVMGSLKTEHSSYPAGTVIYQSIKAGEKVEKQTKIDITVSSGSQESSESSSKSGKKMVYRIKFYPPAGKEKFLVTVFNVNESEETPIFKKTFKASDAKEKGYISQEVEAPEDACFKIYYDGEAANTEGN